MKYLFLSSLLFCSGCGVLFSNVKPLDEKSDEVAYLNLAKENSSTWHQLDAKSETNSGSSSANNASDVSFQSSKTDGLISLNSSCRDSLGRPGQVALEPFARELLLGMTDITENLTEPFSISAHGTQPLPAIQTTVTGKMNDEPVKIRTIVFRKDKCIYDLIYLSRPDKFQTHLQDFSRFISSVRVP